jgi:hypothetical protein
MYEVPVLNCNMSLMDCDDVVCAVTAAEMIRELCERAVDEGMDGEELLEYRVFAGAAVYALVSELPEYNLFFISHLLAS